MGYAAIHDSLSLDSKLAPLDADGSMAMESGHRDSRFALSRFTIRFACFCRLAMESGCCYSRFALTLLHLASITFAGLRRGDTDYAVSMDALIVFGLKLIGGFGVLLVTITGTRHLFCRENLESGFI